MIPRWHYAVVIGIDGPEGTVVLRSGTDARRETPIDVFLRTWSRGDFWAFTALRPGELPSAVNRQKYVTAVAALEEIGMYDDAALAWRAALEEWPDDAIVLFGLGNTLRNLGRLGEAERVYRGLLAARPDLVAARNNLAIVLRMQSQFEEAITVIERAIQQTDDSVLLEELLDTKQEIERSASESLR
jgi:tetratricopeptide (TPR) repeat protein